MDHLDQISTATLLIRSYSAVSLSLQLSVNNAIHSRQSSDCPTVNGYISHETDRHTDGHGRLCLCVCLSPAAFPHYCTDPDVTWGNGRGCPQALHYWADLQLVNGFRCYDNIHIFKLIALYTANAYSTELEMSASACTRSMASLLSCRPSPAKTTKTRQGCEYLVISATCLPVPTLLRLSPTPLSACR